MNREDMIRMAKEAGWQYADGDSGYEPLWEFAALVASAEREKHKWDIHSCSPTCNRYACVATREAVLAEREACAKVCEDIGRAEEMQGIGNDYAEAIRARGQA